jgi:hypothetical protein
MFLVILREAKNLKKALHSAQCDNFISMIILASIAGV